MAQFGKLAYKYKYHWRVQNHARKSTVLSQKSLFLPPLLVMQARPSGNAALSVTEGSAAKRYLVAKERRAVKHHFP